MENTRLKLLAEFVLENEGDAQRVAKSGDRPARRVLLRRSGHFGTYFHRTMNLKRLIDDCRQAVA